MKNLLRKVYNLQYSTILLSKGGSLKRSIKNGKNNDYEQTKQKATDGLSLRGNKEHYEVQISEDEQELRMH